MRYTMREITIKAGNESLRYSEEWDARMSDQDVADGIERDINNATLVMSDPALNLTLERIIKIGKPTILVHKETTVDKPVPRADMLEAVRSAMKMSEMFAPKMQRHAALTLAIFLHSCSLSHPEIPVLINHFLIQMDKYEWIEIGRMQ